MIENKFATGALIVSGEDIPKPEKIHFTNSELAFEIYVRGLTEAKTHGLKVAIHADVDFDGISSFYEMYRLTIDEIGRLGVLPCINAKRVHGITAELVASINNINKNGKVIPLLVIVDSSTNNVDLIKQLNCDVVVIDHHEVEIDYSELTGNTVGGQYAIINNEVDNISDMSCAEVIYEWLRYNNCEAWLENNKLQSWVAVSLFSDVIESDNLRNQWFIQQLVDKVQVEGTLSTMFKSAYKNSTFCKSDISFSLVPIVNATIRMGKSLELLNYIVNKPDRIGELKHNKEEQAKKREIALSPANREGRLVEYADIAYYCLDGLEELGNMDGFAGLVAMGLQQELKKSILVYSTNEDGIHGSFRLSGVMTTYNFKARLAEQEGMTASGHRDAFGFTVAGENAIERLIDKIIELNSRYAGSEGVKESEVVVYVDSEAQMRNLKFSGELARIGTINAHVTTTKQIMIKVPNNDNNVKVDYVGKDISMRVLGEKVRTYRDFERNKDYVYLYAEKANYLNIYLDGVRP